ncbi:MAG: HNH endonuclease [Spartobacteria bacterium]|nr:HNH endonuclease [Spartobacteria bacterium]
MASHDTIRASLSRAIGVEHEATADLLRYLAEYEHRQLHLRDGFSSIYVFLTRGHGYSEGAAARRSTVAKFSRHYPTVLISIAAGDLSLSVVDLLARAVNKQELSADHVPTLLSQLKRKSKTEAESILAEWGCRVVKGPQRERIREVGITAVPCEPIATEARENSFGFAFNQASTNPSKQESADCSQDTEDSLDHDQPIETEFQISLRLSKAAMNQLKRAQELLGTNDIASTIEKLASFHNDKKDPLKNPKQAKTIKTTLPPLAAVTDRNGDTVNCNTVPSKPRKTMQTTNSRYIAPQTRRATYQKSSGQCSYVDSITGRRCEERKHLEVDHINPFAKGGDHSPENLQILCRAHNMMRARDEFGDRFIENKIAARGS